VVAALDASSGALDAELFAILVAASMGTSPIAPTLLRLAAGGGRSDGDRHGDAVTSPT
jgi:hypothetical protein